MGDCVDCPRHGSLEKSIEANEKWASVKFEAIDAKMVATAKVLDSRLESLNHIKQQRQEDRGEFLRKDVYDAKTAVYDGWIITVEKRFSTAESKAATWTAAIGLFFLLVQVGLHWIQK